MPGVWSDECMSRVSRAPESGSKNPAHLRTLTALKACTLCQVCICPSRRGFGRPGNQAKKTGSRTVRTWDLYAFY
eukprot:14168762-Heterocapsa_arctica.AAC.1